MRSIKITSYLMSIVIFALILSSCGKPTKLNASTLNSLSDKNNYVYVTFGEDRDDDWCYRALQFNDNATKIFPVNLESGKIDESKSRVIDFNLIDDDTFFSERLDAYRAHTIYVSEKKDYIIFTEQDDPDATDDAIIFFTKQIMDHIIEWYQSPKNESGVLEPIWDDSLKRVDLLVAQFEAFREMKSGNTKTQTTTSPIDSMTQQSTTISTQLETTAAVETQPQITTNNTTVVSSTVAHTYQATTTPPSQTNSPEIYDTVFFGSYEQDNNVLNGSEAIEWIVLSRQDTRYLVISKYGLASAQYNNYAGNTSWDSCSLRTWLNNNFLYTAFSANEQQKVTDSLLPTGDRVFCLSIDEAKMYLPNEEQRKALVTEAAVASGAYMENGYCGWWLRDPGDTPSVAARVNIHGEILTSESSEGGVERRDYAVRPAMWIVLD